MLDDPRERLRGMEKEIGSLLSESTHTFQRSVGTLRSYDSLSNEASVAELILGASWLQEC